MKEFFAKLPRHPLGMCLFISFSLGFVLTFLTLLNFIFLPEAYLMFIHIGYTVFWGMFVSFVVFLPITMFIMECILLCTAYHDEELYQRGRLLDLAALGTGFFCEVLYLTQSNVRLLMDWPEQLTGSEIHAPISVETLPTFLTIIVVAVAGYVLINFLPLRKMPPLIPILGISAMYLGLALNTIWTIQMMRLGPEAMFLIMALYIERILIVVRTILHKLEEWNQWKCRPERVYHSRFFGKMNRILENASYWPLYAAAGAAVLLGILIAVLMLFGQAPDSIVKAFTDTSNWTLSQKLSPQNARMDEHYLCTVAAGGHREVVKPLRMGVRHGHRVVVNRQLCIANAFEQVLEERTPHFHRAVRNFYDRYGFPLSRLIRTQEAADVVYIIMKPLEWIFLLVLYLTCTDPENRIAVQYTGARNVQEVHENMKIRKRKPDTEKEGYHYAAGNRRKTEEEKQ